ncbi:MAG: UDP-2,3-diacylglucosamine diphosphatase LpxI [Desulfobacterales bacterium]
MINSKIGLIAGSGQFPIIFSKEAKSNGLAVYAIAYINEADERLEDYVEAIDWVYIGQVERLIQFFKKNQITQAAMMGGIRKAEAYAELHLDAKGLELLARVPNTQDDGLLRAFAGALEDEGIRIQEATSLLSHLLASEGCWTKRRATPTELKDIDFGWQIAKDIGRLDIGQCVVVCAGSVLAVEAIDGTDATIRRGGRLGDGKAVVVKVCKPKQDTRFDIPAVGVGTIEAMQAVGAKVLAIETGKTVVFDRQAMINLADQFDMTVIALT